MSPDEFPSSHSIAALFQPSTAASVTVYWPGTTWLKFLVLGQGVVAVVVKAEFDRLFPPVGREVEVLNAVGAGRP